MVYAGFRAAAERARGRARGVAETLLRGVAGKWLILRRGPAAAGRRIRVAER